MLRASDALALARNLDASAVAVVAAADAWERETSKPASERDKGLYTTLLVTVREWRALRGHATAAGVP
jgi:hypothetical protein